MATVFRFQNLLGDFSEYHYNPIVDRDVRKKLIERCLDAIRRIHSEYQDKEILVTSDSITFLREASKLEHVHIIPGTLIHMDGNKNGIPGDYESFEVYLKSFLDFYMLSEAERIYRIGTSYMYPSAFPVYAAKVHNIPFESIVI